MAHPTVYAIIIRAMNESEGRIYAGNIYKSKEQALQDMEEYVEEYNKTKSEPLQLVRSSEILKVAWPEFWGNSKIVVQIDEYDLI